MKRTICSILVGAGLLLLASSVSVDADQYGGYDSLSGNNSSGFFRTEKIGNRYYFITPDNHAMWSRGVCFAKYSYNPAWDFFNCPSLGYAPAHLNQIAKSNSSSSTWLSNMRSRLSYWGFNALSAGSDPSITDMTRDVVICDMTARAYNYHGCPKVANHFADVFDSRFDAGADAAARDIAAVWANKQYLMGVSPDNELQWQYKLREATGMVDTHIAQPYSSYAKVYWTYQWLKPRYNDSIAALNTAYGTSFADWDAVAAASSIPNNSSYPARYNDKLAYLSQCLLPPDPNPSDLSPQVSLADMFIALPASCSGKQWWIASILQQIYGTLQNLNVAYGTNFTSWTGSEATSVANVRYIADSPVYPSRYNDKLTFMYWIAQQYYEKARIAIRRYDANHLIFSDRFTVWWYEHYDDPYTRPFIDKIFIASRGWMNEGNVDVWCFNTYRDTSGLESSCNLWSRAFTHTRRPMMITEDSLMANDTITFDSVWNLSTQMDRAEYYDTKFRYITDTMFNDPNGGGNAYPFIGTVWFDYFDCPSLGNIGEERHNYGILNVMDEPYLPLVEVMRQLHSQQYWHLYSGNPIILPSAPTLSTPADGASVNTTLPTFNWSAMTGAASYVLLISPVLSNVTHTSPFTEEQTIRISGITGTSYTLPNKLCRGYWCWTVKAIDSSGRGGHYADPRWFSTGSVPPGEINSALSRGGEEMSGWMQGFWNPNTRGAGFGTVFRDTGISYAGNSSAKLVYTIYSYDKDTQAKNAGTASISTILSPGETDYSGVSNFTFWIYPKAFAHTDRTLISPSKYLYVAVYDATSGSLISSRIDPTGSLPMNQWSQISIPFPSGVPRTRVTHVEFFINCGSWYGAGNYPAWDQRMIFYIDGINP